MSNYKVNKYPDGTSYVNQVETSPVTFRINSYEDLWHLNQYVDAFNSQYGFPPNITIPNLLDAQADRRFNKGESSGLKLVCKFLNTLKVKKYYIYHPHNPEVVEALIDNVELMDNSHFVTMALYHIGAEYPSRLDDEYFQTKQHLFIDQRVVENTILMSADAGGFKPLIKLCDKIGWTGETFMAGKHRKYDGNETRLTQFIDRNNFNGKDILIVDDISVRGGTFKGLAALLKERNVGKLYLAVSHITLENLGEDPITNYFDLVFTTNSKYDNFYAPDGIGGTQPSNLHIEKLF